MATCHVRVSCNTTRSFGSSRSPRVHAQRKLSMVVGPPLAILSTGSRHRPNTQFRRRRPTSPVDPLNRDWLRERERKRAKEKRNGKERKIGAMRRSKRRKSERKRLGCRGCRKCTFLFVCLCKYYIFYFRMQLIEIRIDLSTPWGVIWEFQRKYILWWNIYYL